MIICSADDHEPALTMTANTAEATAQATPTVVRKRAFMSQAFQSLVVASSAPIQPAQSSASADAATAPPKINMLSVSTVRRQKADAAGADAVVAKASRALAQRFGIDPPAEVVNDESAASPLGNDSDSDAPPPLLVGDPSRQFKKSMNRHDMLTKMRALEMLREHSVRHTAW